MAVLRKGNEEVHCPLLAATADSACSFCILPPVDMGSIPDFRHAPRWTTFPSGRTPDQVSRCRDRQHFRGRDPQRLFQPAWSDIPFSGIWDIPKLPRHHASLSNRRHGSGLHVHILL